MPPACRSTPLAAVSDAIFYRVGEASMPLTSENRVVDATAVVVQFRHVSQKGVEKLSSAKSGGRQRQVPTRLDY